MMPAAVEAPNGAASLLAYDRAHLWHPYTSMTDPAPTHLVTGADGVRLRLADGRVLIDAMSSWWSAIHGYRHPVLDGAARDQLDEMAHVMFGGLTHPPAVRLARLLVDVTPAPLQHVFFADSGSVAVEVALKMALQYQRGKGRAQRSRMLALHGGYHGDTSGAMAVTDPAGGMHTMFTGVLPRHVFADRPPAGLTADVSDWAAGVRALVAGHQHELAGIICEPVLQGAGGMHVYNPTCLQVLRDIADEHDLVFVVDEIATGFGRTGALFACDHAGVLPDVMCIGKALTGGYLTLGAVLCTGPVAQAIGASESGVLMHGPTFMANPLACAVAAASVTLLVESGWEAGVRRVERGLRTGLQAAHRRAQVRDVRVLGAAGVVQLAAPVDVHAASAVAADHGVWVRPFRDLIYTMPPYVTSDDDLAIICAAVTAAAGA